MKLYFMVSYPTTNIECEKRLFVVTQAVFFFDVFPRKPFSGITYFSVIHSFQAYVIDHINGKIRVF